MSSPATHINAAAFSVRGFTSTRKIVGVIAVAVIFIVPALIYGVPANKDLLNHFRFALPFYDSLGAGHFYPSWLAESNSGYGDPSFRFYPPALYYLLSLTRALTGNWYAATLLSLGLLTRGCTGMYFWTRTILSESSRCGGNTLALAPYHVNQLYQAFLLAEFAGAAVCRLRSDFLNVFAGVGVTAMWPDCGAYALLTLTHLPLAVVGSLAWVFMVSFELSGNVGASHCGC